MATSFASNGTPHWVTRRRITLWVLLVVGLMSATMLTYNGQLEIADQMQYFDAVSSQARFSDHKIDLALWERLPLDFPRRDPLPLRPTIAEPGFILAAAPLHWLAERIPGIGLVHTTFLFNIAACALISGVVFWYALALGFSERVAVLGAVSLSLLTIMLPYSQTFFREPLMMLWLSLAAVYIERAQQVARPPAFLYIAFALLLLWVAFMSKDALLLALPGIAVLLTPDALWRRRFVRRGAALLLFTLGAAAIMMAFTDVLSGLSRRTLPIDLLFDPEYTRTALHTYVFSPG
ncbi:MAG: hypothetical protein H7Y11_00635, partial [Armatimonadetes bacterium]|nr:hypothetical protein [Anaerolineae bacterium]